MVPERAVDPSTGELTTSTEIVDLVINPSQGDDKKEIAILGRTFLSSAYLSVNHDANTFTIWEADTSAKMGALAALDEKNVRNDVFCVGETSPGNQDGSQSSSSNPVPTKKLSTGAIAGIAVGAVAFAGLALGILALLFRRTKKKEVAELEGKHLFEGPPPPLHSKPNFFAVPAEMSAETDRKYEADGRELKRGEVTVAELDGTSTGSYK